MKVFIKYDGQIIENESIINIPKNDKDNYHHIVNVMRKKMGDIIEIGVKGKTYDAKILSIDPLNFLVLNRLEASELNIEIDVFQGLPKLDKLEDIIDKSIELGVSKIIPLECIRSVSKISKENEEKKFERWNKIALSAAKQSKRDIVPQVTKKLSLKNKKEVIDFFEKENYTDILVFYEKEKDLNLKQYLKGNKNKNEKRKFAVIIGPEGGFDEREIEFLNSIGAKSITLGKRILRTETAPIAVLSMIQYEFME